MNRALEAVGGAMPLLVFSVVVFVVPVIAHLEYAESLRRQKVMDGWKRQKEALVKKQPERRNP